MNTKLGAGLFVGILVLLGAQACIFGGGDDDDGSAPSRQGAIPTATLPATMANPVLLGQSQGGSGSTTGTGSNATKTYVVKSGDTLGGIAAAEGVPAEQQAAWITEVTRLNNLTDPRLLAVGDELILPIIQASPTPQATGTPGAQATAANRTATPGSQATATRTATTAAAAATPTTTASGSGDTYTVVSGDYPLLIAQKLNVPEAAQNAWVNELVALNDINPNNLTVGQVLELPASTP